MKKNDKAVNILVPAILYSDLKNAAERKHISLASLIRMACVEWLEKDGGITSEYLDINSAFDAMSEI